MLRILLLAIIHLPFVMSQSEGITGDPGIALETAGERAIMTAHGAFLRASFCNSQIASNIVDVAPARNACEQWYIENYGGEVGLKTASSPTRYLRASNEGVVDLTDSRDASTMWRAYENKDGSLSFQSPFDGFLAVTPGGHVHVTVRDEDRTSTIFRLVPWTGPLIASRLADIPIRSAIENVNVIINGTIGYKSPEQAGFSFNKCAVLIVCIVGICALVYSIHSLRRERLRIILNAPLPPTPSNSSYDYKAVIPDDCDYDTICIVE